MVSHARRKLVGRDRKAVFHCTVRCLRRVFLCGNDRFTGKDYSHRHRWIWQRKEELAGLFAALSLRAESSLQ